MNNHNAIALSTLLGNLFVLYVKTLNYHWHIKGENFYQSHLLLEEQYNGLSESIDTIAERIVIYGKKAPSSMSEYLKLSIIKEDENTSKNAIQMLSELAEDYTKISDHLLKEIEAKVLDPITEDICIQEIQKYTKNVWMLKSHKA